MRFECVKIAKALACFILILLVTARAKSAASAADFTGEWRRTNIEKAYEATIVITNQTEKSFDFEFYGSSGANEGELSTTANFTGGEAICVYEDEYFSLKVEFALAGNVLKVSSDMENALGIFGAGVTIDGEYVKGEPQYTNAKIVEETIGSGEILEKVKNLLGSGAFETLVTIMEEGTGYDSGDLTYSGFVNGAGMGADLLIDGDKIYCLIYDIYSEEEDPGYTFYTNDAEYSKKLHPKMAENLREGVPLKFVHSE